jgi:hypothetical protein
LELKSFLWVLLGIVIGVGGFYFVTMTPGSNVAKANSPTNVALMFTQAVDSGNLYSVQELMTPQQRKIFTSAELTSVRQYIGVGTKAGAGAFLNNYEVITFGNGHAVTLWLTPTLNKNQTWQVQRISEGAKVASENSKP